MKKIIIYFILFFSIHISFADPASDLIEKIKNIHSMTANFNQKLIDGQTSNNLNSKGNMSLKKPQYFKWITTSPNNQEIVSNGTNLWIYDGDLDQLIIKKVSNDIAQFPYLILLSRNTNNINKLFTVTEQNNNSYILKPKNDQMIDSIKIKFTSTNQLEYLEISTSLNQFTKIEFSDVKTDVNISDTSFNFRAPENTDIIDETKST
ncbi:outer membrane lipoprotein chaperone LolA [Francisella hispaniensis]|uniref:Outer-membrane lipoprotein carrier protein n=1 Tax=Francisella hispaniensis FSC454 TaxID=1088883 RepID=A0AAC9NN00_9GAMM|nr:outer membrane lipoprotein chaperone LolA [Francisella hispaniensis]APD49885.1 outer membrane lipoprotein carrier protein LolA [Francisella hispaniensis FSC454]KYW86324.1 outer membrane lipoprotein carrier protein LolA [Francisella hispaniensis FSC454]